ncbi:unnamed protein product [Penicillium roqueforti FM164]|uniref:Genomic scaffold, ProqFM164S02 n=1 Tax=Penicillium roqueforti (strain FM164) TaxID=1365484 RepID=W6QC26_PENRF|nr:unnamed protein product [Penicillium roqueforti FM164]
MCNKLREPTGGGMYEALNAAERADAYIRNPGGRHIYPLLMAAKKAAHRPIRYSVSSTISCCS